MRSPRGDRTELGRAGRREGVGIISDHVIRKSRPRPGQRQLWLARQLNLWRD